MTSSWLQDYLSNLDEKYTRNYYYDLKHLFSCNITKEASLENING